MSASPNTVAPTHQDITNLVQQAYSEATAKSDSGTWREPASFYGEADINAITAAHAWWPRNCPDTMSWDRTLLAAVFTYRTNPTNANRLTELLALYARPVVRWLELEGKSTEHPNEDRAERMRRLNRERMAAQRAAAKAEAAGEEAPPNPVADAWRAVEEARRVRRDVVAAEKAKVRAAYDAMTVAAEHKRMVEEEQDQLVHAAEAAHRAAKGL